MGIVCHFLGVARASDKIFIISSEFHLSYLEPLFAVTKTVGSPGKVDSLRLAYVII